MNCAKCSRDVTSAKDVVKCVECNSHYHAGCSRIRTLAKLTAMSARSLSVWRCDDCAQETSPILSNKSEPEEPKVAELLIAMKRNMEKHFETIEKQLETLQTSHEELKSRLISVESENEALKVECVSLKVANHALESRVSGLEIELADLQQYTRNHNVEIRGIPLTRNEDAYVILSAVAKALDIEFNRDSISVAHRLPKPQGKNFHPSIVVQFSSRTTRAKWIIASKEKRIKTTDLASTLSPGPIYVVDHLTARNKALLGRAKYLVRQGKLAYAWSRDGKILVRKTTDSQALRVNSMDQVEDIAGMRGGVGGGGVGDSGGSSSSIGVEGVKTTPAATKA